MGCSGMQRQKNLAHITELEIKRPLVTIECGGRVEEVLLHRYALGAYYDLDPPPEQKLAEQRFRERCLKALDSCNVRLSNIASLEELWVHVLRNKAACGKILAAAIKLGSHCDHRWALWYVSGVFNQAREARGMGLLDQEGVEALAARCPSEGVALIRKDSTRGGSGHAFFTTEGELGNAMLIQSCQALAAAFPTVGYVQGMSFPVTFLLEVSGLAQAQVHNFLVCFLTKPHNLYLGLYAPNFPLLGFLFCFFRRALERAEPEVAKVLAELGVPLEVFLPKWFMSFFAACLDKPFLLRAWDFLALGDASSLAVVAVAAVVLARERICERDFGEVSQLLQEREQLNDCLRFKPFSAFLAGSRRLFDAAWKARVLVEYNCNLVAEEKERFRPYFDSFSNHWSTERTPEQLLLLRQAGHEPSLHPTANRFTFAIIEPLAQTV